MAEERDDAQKTEAPSQRRLEEARAKGQLVVSREVATMLLFGAAALLAVVGAPQASRSLAATGATLLRDAHALPLDGTGLAALGWNLAAALGPPVLLPLLLLFAAPILAALLQNAVVWSAEPLKPKLERISPLAGARRLFGLRSLAELGKSLVKLALVGGAVLWLLRPELPQVLGSSALEPGPFLALMAALAGRGLLVLAVAASIVALIDYGHRHVEFMRQMRMSRQELLDELKQSDGDPHVKQRQKAVRLERARRRMMADVPRATVLITNPTHYAVALRYRVGETPAPEVLAKGLDGLALRIRKVAAEHGIPVIENPPLARALHAACDPGDLIPPIHYQAVAEIISYVLRLGERRSPV
ncbi:MAG: flagellar biosynthesis protein FlhB [Geminicoccaceae bacterium]